ncbi:MAG: response regulator [Pseudomonadota bacterium]
MDDSQVIGTREAAQQLGVSVRTVQLWVEKGELEAWKTPGGHRRVLRSSVERVLQQRAGQLPTDDGEPIRILIVEDDVTMQSYYTALLNILLPQAQLILAENGYEGLVALGRVEPKLMLVDVDMPGMDGISMLRSLEEKGLGGAATVAVVTGLDEEQLAARGGVPRSIPVFSKPIGIDDLRRLTDALTDDVVETVK